MTARRSKEETELQISIVTFLRKNFACVVHHSPNGGERGLLAGKEFKAMGVTAGYPDLIIHAWYRRTYLMEIKSATGPLSTSQKKLIPELEEIGYAVPVVRTYEEAKSLILGWGLPPKMPRTRTAVEKRTGF